MAKNKVDGRYQREERRGEGKREEEGDLVCPSWRAT